MSFLELSLGLLLVVCIVGICADWRNGQWGNELSAISNCPLQTHRNPDMYFHVDQYGRRFERRCPTGQAFFEHKCSCDHTPPPCDLRASSKGPMYYEQYSNGYWIGMACAAGTAFNELTCLCSTFL